VNGYDSDSNEEWEAISESLDALNKKVLDIIIIIIISPSLSLSLLSSSSS
jgi:hypothetical protein